jgi:PAS domain S-box-containing protein
VSSVDGLLPFDRELFDAVIEHASDAIGIVDAAGAAVYVNPALERALGYATGELLGQSVLSFAHPDDLAAASEGLMRLVNDVGVTVSLDARWRTKRGAWRTLSGHSRSYRGKDGTLRVVLQARDVTEEKQASDELARHEAALRETQERLRASQKMEAIGRLAGGVAHDFNNLLTVILSCTDLLSRTIPPGSTMTTFLGEISGAAERGAALTRQLLTFSRKQPMQARTIDLNGVVVEVQTMLRRLIGETIALTTELDDHARYVRADPGQIEQVILNLVLNARDALGERGGRIALCTKRVDAPRASGSVPPGSYVALRVEDDGVGMTEEVQTHLFEPFFTTKPRGHGTGLGLATVYGIVKQTGGHVSVRSAPGEGTTFEVLLPSVDDVPQALAGAIHPVTRPRGDETILLVEDEAPLRRLIREVLTGSGYAVVEAADGEEAMRAISARDGEQAPIDLVLSDVVMPGMSGHQLAMSVRARWPAARVLLMSGYDEEAGREENEPILGKPFTASALARRVRETLDEAESNST